MTKAQRERFLLAVEGHLTRVISDLGVPRPSRATIRVAVDDLVSIRDSVGLIRRDGKL